MTHFRSLTLALLLVVSPLAAGCASQSSQPGTNPSLSALPYQADFEIHLDRSAMADRRVTASDVTATLARFFESHPFFSLTDLRELRVRNADGGDVALKEFASVDVWFGAARTEIVVGPDAELGKGSGKE